MSSQLFRPIAVVVLLLVGHPAAAEAAATLRQGMSGPAVHALQDRLADLRYLPPRAVTGTFDARTWHAVVALQGWSRVARDGIVGPQTRRALHRARRPRPSSRRAGMEVHVAEQVLLLVRHRGVRRAIHVSTGAGGATPAGRFAITGRERLSWSRPFQVWMPFAQYFYGGYALHEYPSVPAYPASHGCVRVPAQESRVAWRFGRVGMRLWVT